MPWPISFCTHVMTHRNGKTCDAPAMRYKKFCYHHDPDRRERKPMRAFAASIAPPESLSDIQRNIADTLSLILQGKLDSRRAGKILRGIEASLVAYKARARQQRSGDDHRNPAGPAWML